MTKKLTLEFISNEFKKEGYTVLSDSYINSSTPISYLCCKGHKYQVSWNKWKTGRRCPFCNDKGRVRIVEIDDIREDMKKEGYILLTTTYINSSTKLDYICPNGHNYSTSWDSWKFKGNRCGICSNKIKLTTSKVAAAMKKEGYVLLDEYKNAFASLKVKCPNGHLRNITWSNWLNGNRCAECSGKLKHSTSFIRNMFSKYGYKLLTPNYINGKQKLKYECNNGHTNYVTWNNFNNGTRCPDCVMTGSSKSEKELVVELKKLKLDLIENDRNIIKPFELDIVIPSKKIAIEYCGLYWHSELIGKDRKYHLNKLNMCKKAGYQLITIFEDEWMVNKDIVLSRLKTILGISDKNIYARKCIITEITARQAREFCNANHLQGYGSGSSVKLGAFFNSSLVAIMTFSKLSISKGYNKKENGKWELHRFCSKLDYRVVGVASKLLRYFETNFKWLEIISYADLRWSNGNLYNKLLFKFINNTKPNYWYFKNNIKRLHRFSLRKLPNEPVDLSEWRLRQAAGWNRIWDCGNLKFSKKSEEI